MIIQKRKGQFNTRKSSIFIRYKRFSPRATESNKRKSGKRGIEF